MCNVIYTGNIPGKFCLYLKILFYIKYCGMSLGKELSLGQVDKWIIECDSNVLRPLLMPGSTLTSNPPALQSFALVWLTRRSNGFSYDNYQI